MNINKKIEKATKQLTKLTIKLTNINGGYDFDLIETKIHILNNYIETLLAIKKTW